MSGRAMGRSELKRWMPPCFRWLFSINLEWLVNGWAWMFMFSFVRFIYLYFFF